MEHTAAAPSIGGRATFAHVVHSEWTKFRTVRSSAYTLLATALLGVGTALLFTHGTGEAYSELSAEARAKFDPTGASLLGGCLFAQLAIGALGTLMVTSEYATGMIGTSLTVAPRRGRLLGAKALVVAPVALLVGEIIGFTAFLAGQPLLARQGAPHASLGEPGVLRAVIGAGLYLALVGLLGVALGVLARSTAGALIILVAATIIIPFSLGPFLPSAVRRFWPVIAGLDIMSARQGHSGFSPWIGLGVMSAGVAGIMLVALAVLRSRDA